MSERAFWQPIARFRATVLFKSDVGAAGYGHGMTTDVRTFLRTHARVLEMRLAEFHLDGDQAAGLAAIAALEAYRNADGGFGHGLEADVLAPQSQPLFADFAFGVLDDLAAEGSPEVRARAAESVARTLPFLAEVADTSGGVPIVLPSIEDHPHADHWDGRTYQPELNPTARLVGVARALGVEHPWLDQAAAFCRQAIDDGKVDDAHTARCVTRFCETEPDRAWAEPAYRALGEQLPKLPWFQAMPGEGYGLTPLHFAPSPDSPARPLFSTEQVEAHLDALERTRLEDGGFPVTWEPPGPASVLAWRGVWTLDAERTLRAYGRR